MGSWHPESPQRLDAISDQLLASGLMPYLDDRQAPQASRHDILRVHTVQYLDSLRQHVPGTATTRSIPIPDEPAHLRGRAVRGRREAWPRSTRSWVARRAPLLCGASARAPCLPLPGHGLCFLNNVAIAARHALDFHGLSRVAIVDFDVHHGNGTEDVFAGDERVLMCSFFQHPFFPNSGADHPAANMLNVPVPAYTARRGGADPSSRTPGCRGWRRIGRS